MTNERRLLVRCLADIPDYEPTASFKLTKEHLILYDTGERFYPDGYYIKLADFKRPMGLYKWLRHLWGKTWIDKKIMVEIVRIALEHNQKKGKE